MIEVSQALECKQLLGQGASIGSISKQVGISRNTVRRYLRGEGTPGKYQMTSLRSQPVRDEIRARVREVLEAERKNETPRKQRLTAARIPSCPGTRSWRNPARSSGLHGLIMLA